MSYKLAVRRNRVQRSNVIFNRVRDLCARNGIRSREIAHGYQFILNEYRINWFPSTNRVNVQYALPGDGSSVSFTKKGTRDNPRIVVALQELVDLTRSEGRCHA